MEPKIWQWHDLEGGGTDEDFPTREAAIEAAPVDMKRFFVVGFGWSERWDCYEAIPSTEKLIVRKENGTTCADCKE